MGGTHSGLGQKLFGDTGGHVRTAGGKNRGRHQIHGCSDWVFWSRTVFVSRRSQGRKQPTCFSCSCLFHRLARNYFERAIFNFFLLRAHLLRFCIISAEAAKTMRRFVCVWEKAVRMRKTMILRRSKKVAQFFALQKRDFLKIIWSGKPGGRNRGFSVGDDFPAKKIAWAADFLTEEARRAD